jgi:GDP-4-dehydro-6-deoxy-D-mannose reductase
MNSIRDFIDVRDVAAAYLAILELDSPLHRTFNVCTGEGHSIEAMILAAQDILGTNRPVRFENQPNSSDDIPYLVGDPTRLKQATGWGPRFTLSHSLHDMIKTIRV